MRTKQFKSNLLKAAVCFWLCFTCFYAVFIVRGYGESGKREQEQKRSQVVALNEIRQLSQGDDREQLQNAIEALESEITTQISQGTVQALSNNSIIMIYAGVTIFLVIIFLYIYLNVIRPFNRLNEFASQVAAGNLDLPLEFERNNMFGVFTWAFDSMRLEIRKARACEKEAIENNKTVISTISHDIKTPIASIRAYCEALLAGMDHNPERRQRYTKVIMNKCDEVSKLTNDLFLHSLSDLDKLKINAECYDSRQKIGEILQGIALGNARVELIGEIPSCQICVDGRRLEQVYENLIANADKYAPGSPIRITHRMQDGYLITAVRDYGNGIADKDFPFIFQKFYRGENTQDKPGAGLGLFIVKYIMEQMKGKVTLHNTEQGLLAEIWIKIEKYE